MGKMKEIRVGAIGLGQRGPCMSLLCADIEGVKVTALCDIYEDRIEKTKEMLSEKNFPTPLLCSTNYHDIINSDDVDVIMIFAAWEVHIPIAIEAMEKGKPVAVEVAGAYSIDQCWELVKTYERTKTPIMMLENCCYGQREMMILNMLKHNFFGEVVHYDGAYCHDLRYEIAGGIKNRHYRYRNYQNRNCENYPTHELGPIAQFLDINRGNRFVSLTSMASKSVGLSDYIKKKLSDDNELMNTTFKQGDIVTTLIKCARGETVRLTLDTTLPRYNTRGLCVHGTDAFLDAVTETIIRDGDFDMEDEQEWLEKNKGNEKKYLEEYQHPLWKKYIDDGIREGHGGMDWLVLNAFFDSLKQNKPMPIDVYDMATWMAITPLTEISIQNGGAPVDIPDFTNGEWLRINENK